jgi:hypothetical protein
MLPFAILIPGTPSRSGPEYAQTKKPDLQPIPISASGALRAIPWFGEISLFDKSPYRPIRTCLFGYLDQGGGNLGTADEPGAATER